MASFIDQLLLCIAVANGSFSVGCAIVLGLSYRRDSRFCHIMLLALAYTMVSVRPTIRFIYNDVHWGWYLWYTIAWSLGSFGIWKIMHFRFGQFCRLKKPRD